MIPHSLTRDRASAREAVRSRGMCVRDGKRLHVTDNRKKERERKGGEREGSSEAMIKSESENMCT